LLIKGKAAGRCFAVIAVTKHTKRETTGPKGRLWEALNAALKGRSSTVQP